MSEALVIDDNRNTADALCQMLSVFGIDARPAYGSRPALTVLGTQTPHLILLDINMPGVDGLEILAYLKREPRLAVVPVVVVTSDDQPEIRYQVMSGGASGMLIKPVTLNMLEETLKQIGVLGSLEM